MAVMEDWRRGSFSSEKKNGEGGFKPKMKSLLIHLLYKLSVLKIFPRFDSTFVVSDLLLPFKLLLKLWFWKLRAASRLIVGLLIVVALCVLMSFWSLCHGFILFWIFYVRRSCLWLAVLELWLLQLMQLEAAASRRLCFSFDVGVCALATPALNCSRRLAVAGIVASSILNCISSLIVKLGHASENAISTISWYYCHSTVKLVNSFLDTWLVLDLDSGWIWVMKNLDLKYG